MTTSMPAQGGSQIQGITGAAAPISTPTPQLNFATPSALNGYPIFSSPQAAVSSPSGYANANPVGDTPSVVQPQARAMGPDSMMGQNPSAPTAPTLNPWNIKSSSNSGSFDYPLGQNVPPAKLNVM